MLHKVVHKCMKKDKQGLSKNCMHVQMLIPELPQTHAHACTHMHPVPVFLHLGFIIAWLHLTVTK